MPISTENLETTPNIIKSEAKVELKNQLFNLSPNLFEKLVVDLIQRMGYGSYQGTEVICKSSLLLQISNQLILSFSIKAQRIT